MNYSINIHWSEEDKVFIASMPEFGEGAKTHGSTYEEALKNAKEVMELLVEKYTEEGQDLPEPVLV